MTINRYTVSFEGAKNVVGTSPVVQWLGLCTSTSGGTGSIPGRELRSHKPRDMVKKKKSFQLRLWQSLCNSECTKTIVLYILNGYIVWVSNCISIKLFFKIENISN